MNTKSRAPKGRAAFCCKPLDRVYTRQTMAKTVRYTATVTPEERSVVRIEGEIPFAELAQFRASALAELGKNVSIDGFRKGHVPEKVLVERIGEMSLLSDMAERALAVAYPEIIKEHNVDAIGRPSISITKLAPENPFTFTARVAVVPTIALPDYKKIAQGITREPDAVSDQELDEAIANIQRQKIAYERLQKKAAASKDGQTLPTPETVEGEKEPVIPELTDEYVKTLGDFDSVATFKAKLREHLEIEKKKEVASKHRATLTDAIIDKSTVDLPQVLIDAELGQMFGQMEQDLTRANLKIDDYLAHAKKTREDLIKEWTPSAEKRAKLELILAEIAKLEKIEAAADAVEAEVNHLMSHYKDADPARVRAYVSAMMKNDAVMKMLEELSA
jgi:trigger factor